MPKKRSRPDAALRRFEPVSDELVLAAIDRAERHRARSEPGVLLGDIVAHLGFVRTGWTTRNLRPHLDALVAGGLVGTLRRHGLAMWTLTDRGREQLAAHLKSGDVDELPESPQHRVWREARTLSAAHIDGFRMQLMRELEYAATLARHRRRVGSDAWFELAARLQGGDGELFDPRDLHHSSRVQQPRVSKTTFAC